MSRRPRPPTKIDTSFAFQYVDRALHEGLGRRVFAKADQDAVLEFLGDRCVYCGSEEFKRWDHLVAVTRGGETVAGNLVPACAACDDSKQAEEFDVWMRGAAPKSPASRGIGDIDERISRLREYQGHFGYTVVALAQRLSEEERAELARVRGKAAELRREAEELIRRWKTRYLQEPSDES